MTQAIDAFERIIKCVDRYDVSGMDIDTVRNALMRESVDVDPNILRNGIVGVINTCEGDTAEAIIDHLAKRGLLRTPGFVMVPVEPTDAMIARGAFVLNKHPGVASTISVYKAMIEAAQKDTP